MLIEVRGAGFVNRGAELMLRAALHAVSQAFPEAHFAMAPAGTNDFDERARLGLYQKVWIRRFGLQWGRLGWAIPRKLRQCYGLVLDEELNVVLDASGFSYSDQWGDGPTLALASCLRRWKRRRTKLILLPQALGPFTSRSIRKAFAFVVENADVVFARDDISYRHVIELVGERDNVAKAPDFTCLLPGIPPADPDRFCGRFCLVPNSRMMDKVSQDRSSLYPSFCVRCVNCLIDAGQRPFILIHEGDDDIKLAQRVVAELGQPIDIVSEKDALRIKGIIGLCAGLIGSRFHAIVNALSQGVPALAAGWSHKYEMLVGEYGVPDCCVPLSIDQEALKEKIGGLIAPDRRKLLVATIDKMSAIHRQSTKQMWKKVCGVVKQ